ncbi:MAG: insulinase family protein [Acidobacteriota bacterium]|nr:insulinase family protein [Acidobacteriota bacterium]
MIARKSPPGVQAALVLAAALILAAPQLSAQKLERDKAPKAGKAPSLKVPAWTKAKLANGAELIVVEKRDLPLVALNIDFIGGASNYEPADKLGVAALAAQMLSEGTKARTADQLSDAQQLLGTSISASVAGESGTIRFTSLKDKFEPAMALLADMLLNPTFPDTAFERNRARTLVALTQAKDQPNTIAANMFSKVVFGDEHPYGRVVSEKTVRAVTRGDVMAFAAAYFRPGRAVITVAGDIDAKTARGVVEKALAAWPAGGERPAFAYGPVPAPKARMIYLVDKPKAAQSEFALGGPGPPRRTPDYYALQVMNRLLGGIFQSRLNHDIREVKGYSYGVNSGFAFGRGPGAFRAGGGIVSAKSDSALIAFMTHFKGVQGELPFTDDELTVGKVSLIQSLPGRFATVNEIAAAISSLYTEELPETYFNDYTAKIEAVTREDLVRVAKKHIDMDHMSLVIVGDRAAIEGPLKATGIAPIQVLDVEGRPVPVP